MKIAHWNAAIHVKEILGMASCSMRGKAAGLLVYGQPIQALLVWHCADTQYGSHNIACANLDVTVNTWCERQSLVRGIKMNTTMTVIPLA